MTNTPNLSLPYPELSDTADVPRDIKALALKLDTILGGGGGGGGGGTLPLAGASVLDVGKVGQVRAGHELAVADFTSLGLGTPAGLFNLSGLTNLGSGGPLVNLGAVPFGVGINGLAATAAVFAGSTGQALYIADTGAADPFRIRTGSFGCWFRTAKRGVAQDILSKWGAVPNAGYTLQVQVGNVLSAFGSSSGSDAVGPTGVSDVCDDRWHHAVATFDATTARLYVDGVLEAQTGFNAPLFGSAAALNIGAQKADGSTAAANPHYGRADEAFVTPDVLTDDEIRLIYAAKLGHALGVIPTTTRLSIHRRRKGAALAVADFPAQPVRLHNFTGGALTDQGSGGVALVANPGTGAIVDVAGPDGVPLGAKSFSGAHTGLSATDAGLPGGLTTRSYGLWFKTSALVTQGLIGWGVISTDARLDWFGATGQMRCLSGADVITSPFVADGQWHLVVVVEDNAAGDGVKRKLYLDGRLVGVSTVLNAITLAGANRFRLGAVQDGTNPFTGQVDAAFISAGALTIADIAGLYAKGAQDLGASPKNPGDHVERMDATTVLFIGDTLESQHTVDLGVVA